MVAVLPLVALGAFEVVAPAADAVARMADHREAAAAPGGGGRPGRAGRGPRDPAPAARRAPTSALEDAVLRYTGGGPRVLDGLSLAVPAGRHLAVVGPSGAGKSSIVNVLLRFWGLESGTARLGGTSLDDLAQDDVRSRIGWVGQDAHLFPTTIGGNIAVGPARRHSADEIADAARRAQLGPWIDSLPDGMDTPVGERGARLSGGQRQRVALARALLAGAPVLVLDEPTSGLDRPTARRLRRRRGGGIRRDDRRLHHPPRRGARPLRRRGRGRRRPGAYATSRPAIAPVVRPVTRRPRSMGNRTVTVPASDVVVDRVARGRGTRPSMSRFSDSVWAMEAGDPVAAGGLGQVDEQAGADPPVLVVVGDHEGHLGLVGPGQPLVAARRPTIRSSSMTTKAIRST